MTRLHLPPGIALPDAYDRLRFRGLDGAILTNDNINTAASQRPNVSATFGSANTKSDWVQVVSSLSADIMCISMSFISGINAGSGGGLVDIGIGTAGNEVVIVPDILIHVLSQNTVLWFPVTVPKGTRVAFRYQTVTGVGLTCTFSFATLPKGKRPAQRLHNHGSVSSGVSQGTLLTYAGSANTKGAWVELTAATPEPYEAIIPMYDQAGDTSVAAQNIIVDFGVGSAGNEQVVVSNMASISVSGSSVVRREPVGPRPVFIPAGSRIAARYAASNNNNTIGAAVLGVPVT